MDERRTCAICKKIIERWETIWIDSAGYEYHRWCKSSEALKYEVNH